MKSLLLRNKFYLIPYFIMLTIGITILSQIEKGDAIFYFANNRTESLNIFFRFATKMGEIMGYLLFIVIFLFIRFRYSVLIALTAASAGIVAAILKNIFRHPRPKRYFGNDGQKNVANTIKTLTFSFKAENNRKIKKIDKYQ